MTDMQKQHLRQFVISLVAGFGIVMIIYASLNLYRSLTAYQVDTMAIRAQEAQDAGDFDEAIRIRTNIHRTLPADTNNTYNLAVLYFTQKDFEQAEVYAKEFNDLEPNSPNGHLILGNVYIARGDLKSAEKSFSTVYSANNSREAAYYLGALAMGQGNDPTEYLAVATSDPDPYQKATVLLENYEKAQAERNPVYRDALFAFYLLEDDLPHIALELLDIIVEEEKEYRDGYYLRGVALAKIGEREEAAQSLEQALEIDPEHNASKEALAAITGADNPTPTIENIDTEE